MTQHRRSNRAGLWVERPFDTAKGTRATRRIATIPWDHTTPPAPGRPRTGVRPRAVDLPVERDALEPRDAPEPGDAFWPAPLRRRTDVTREAAPPDEDSIGDLPPYHVPYVTPAWVVVGDHAVDAYSVSIGVDALLLQLPRGQVVCDHVVVCLALPITSEMVSLPCTVVARTRARAQQELLRCEISTAPHEVERELELYVSALTSRSAPSAS